MGAFLNEHWDCLGTMFNYQEVNLGASSNFWLIDKANAILGGVDKSSLYSCDLSQTCYIFLKKVAIIVIVIARSPLGLFESQK